MPVWSEEWSVPYKHLVAIQKARKIDFADN